MPFEISLKIIENIEAKIYESYGLQSLKPILDSKDRVSRQISKVIKSIHFPLRLMRLGKDIWFKDFTKFLIVFSAFFFVLYLITGQLQLSQYKEVMNYILLGIIVLSAYVSIFAIPSSFCSYKIDCNYLDVVKNTLSIYENINNEQVALVQENLKILELRSQKRVRGIKTFVAFIFAILTFFGKKIFDMATNSEINYQEFMQAIIPIIITLSIIYNLTEWYSKSINFVFDTSQLGCNQYKFNNANLKD